MCQFCDISKYQVPNKNKSECVCANQNYVDIVTKECKPCDYSCLVCNDSSKCLICSSPLYLTYRSLATDNKSCLCDQNYYDDKINRNIICQKCHSSCLTCNGPFQYDCMTCFEGKIKDEDGKCVCQGNFADKQGKCVCESPSFVFRGYCMAFLSKNQCGNN
jgi:proprotein convertase subtilisin/kexin type 5